MASVEETKNVDKAAKEVARYNRKVAWYVTKRTAKTVLVAAAAILVVSAVFDKAVEREVNKQIAG